jgi:hypothetical protein
MFTKLDGGRIIKQINNQISILTNTVLCYAQVALQNSFALGHTVRQTALGERSVGLRLRANDHGIMGSCRLAREVKVAAASTATRAMP